DGIRDRNVTGVQTCALPILKGTVPFSARILCGRGRVRVVIEISSDERGAAHALGQGVDEQQQSDRDDALEHADRSGQGEVPAGHADVVDVQVQDLDGV